MIVTELLLFEYANKQNYVYNNIPKSIRIWKTLLRNPRCSGDIKYATRCSLITQYRFLLSDIPILKPIIDDYVLQNKQYCKTHIVKVVYPKRYDSNKHPITRIDIKRMRVDIILTVFGKDL